MKKLLLFLTTVCIVFSGCEKKKENPVNGQGELSYSDEVLTFDIGKYSPDAGKFLPNPFYDYYFAFTSDKSEERLDVFLYLDNQPLVDGEYSYITYNYSTTPGVSISLIRQGEIPESSNDGMAIVTFEKLADEKYKLSISLPILEFDFEWTGKLKRIYKSEAPLEEAPQE